MPDPSSRKTSPGWRDYRDVLSRRRGLVLAAVLPILALAALYSFTARPVYTAQGILLIEDEPNILAFQEMFKIESYRDDYVQTQLRILTSRSLADSVITRLGLDRPGGLAPASDPTDDPAARGALIDAFLSRLAVMPVRLTRLAEVAFKDGDPDRAAQVVNTLFDSFIELTAKVRDEATTKATEFLDGQIAELRRELEAAEKTLGDYGARKNIIALSDQETTTVDKLGELNKALTAAQVDRIQKESYYNEIKDISPEHIPQALSNELIQRLREDYGKLDREYQKMQQKYMPDYPEMQRLRKELDSARDSLSRQLANMVSAASADYQAALRRERSLAGAFNQQKQSAITLNSDAILYNSLRTEVANKKGIIDALLRRRSETSVSSRLSGLRASNIRVVDRAEPPLSPSSPKKKMNMVLALLLGLSLGTMLAFVADYFDDSIRGPEDVEKTTGLPTLGVVPSLHRSDGLAEYGDGEGKKRKRTRPASPSGAPGAGPDRRPGESGLAQWLNELPGAAGRKPSAAERPRDVLPLPDALTVELIVHQLPRCAFAEAFRSVRTSLLLSSPDGRVRTLAVTSALPGEGKTATTANLGISLAQAGFETLIVDADFRKPRLHRVFGVPNREGLTNVLAADADAAALIDRTAIPKLSILRAGPVPPNPAELLGSRRMDAFIGEARDTFDAVLFDTPPMLSLADAAILGSRLDGLLLVVRGERTSRHAVARVAESLAHVRTRALGVVLNDMPHRRGEYYHYGAPRNHDRGAEA